MKTKCILLLCMIVFMPGRFFRLDHELQALDIQKMALPKEELPLVEMPEIVTRETWDTLWPMIQKLYNVPLGTKVKIIINGVAYYRNARSLSYCDSEGISTEELRHVLSSAVFHHMEVIPDTTVSDTNQVRGILASQIRSRGFNDIAYHFVIGRDGTIYEGLPIDRMGFHAGGTLESQNYLMAHAPLWWKTCIPLPAEKYDKYFPHYVKGMKMDPDYGRIGISFIGHFDIEGPTEAQKAAAIRLTNWLKYAYDIPDEGIFWHREMRTLVSTWGFTNKYKSKSCPGKYCMKKEEIIQGTIEDTPLSCTKKQKIERA